MYNPIPPTPSSKNKLTSYTAEKWHPFELLNWIMHKQRRQSSLIHMYKLTIRLNLSVLCTSCKLLISCTIQFYLLHLQRIFKSRTTEIWHPLELLQWMLTYGWISITVLTPHQLLIYVQSNWPIPSTPSSKSIIIIMWFI